MIFYQYKEQNKYYNERATLSLLELVALIIVTYFPLFHGKIWYVLYWLIKLNLK